ncbi:MAG: hypothetical protein C0176_02660 [Mesoaciditoga sp.]|uniref:hypothetical protein n=1 Tax=Athalassotoga sp. TaxID=2022597 RepID=UPI000CC9D9E5|nr:MAG: hypothetical protein C0185_01260 [Mesoaciditoga sp.]PMP80332.1 MAG: hypothetical protein C0176_02660 [Mesoaciditoga sp.]
MKMRFVVWSLMDALAFLMAQMSLLFLPFSEFPGWLIYVLMLILGILIVLTVRDIKIGIFVTLSGTLIAMILYFWISFFILQIFGSFNEVIASNLSLSTGVINTIFLYMFCLFGNILAMIFLGFMS